MMINAHHQQIVQHKTFLADYVLHETHRPLFLAVLDNFWRGFCWRVVKAKSLHENTFQEGWSLLHLIVSLVSIWESNIQHFIK